MTERLVLGTAQLGSAYGVKNQTGKPSLVQAKEIVAAAWEAGIRSFDTAQAYGESETVLAQVLSDLGLKKDAKIYTKLNPALDYRDEKTLVRALEGSLQRFKVERVEGLLLHHEEILKFWDDGTSAALRELVRSGKVKSIGVSFYTPQKALNALGWDGIDFIQIPGNVLDKRFESAGVLLKAAKLNKKVFIRSVFLQGLLLFSMNDLPQRFNFAKDQLSKAQELARRNGLTVDELALGYAKTKWPDAQIIFGAETVEQVKRNADIFIKDFPKDLIAAADQAFASVDEQIVNPTLWPK